MLELMICSLVTILPDYLYRRYAQGAADQDAGAERALRRRG
jgi:hypothetical protein